MYHQYVPFYEAVHSLQLHGPFNIQSMVFVCVSVYGIGGMYGAEKNTLSKFVHSNIQASLLFNFRLVQFGVAVYRAGVLRYVHSELSSSENCRLIATAH